MKVHISYETDEEKDAAMDVFAMLDERFPDKKKRFKEPRQKNVSTLTIPLWI